MDLRPVDTKDEEKKKKDLYIYKKITLSKKSLCKNKMHHWMRGLLTRIKLVSSASAKRLAKEQDYYLKNGGLVLEELLGLCDGNCRIPIRYFSAIEIERAIKHSESKIDPFGVNLIVGSLNNRLVLVRFSKQEHSLSGNNIYRDIAITAQMSHLKNVLRLVGCCLEFEEPVMVYEYVEGIALSDLLIKKGNHDQTRKALSWGNRLRISNEVASAVVFLHTEFTTPIIHRNIKPGNVLIDQNSGVAKIVDFSVSISLPPGELEVEDGVYGTYGYADPEYMFQGIVTQKTDVYSFGVLLFELLTGKQFWDTIESNREEGNAMDPLELFNPYVREANVMDVTDPAILEEQGIEIHQQLEEYLDLVKKCTADKGENRPYMIHVARDLCRIDKSYRVLTLGQK